VIINVKEEGGKVDTITVDKDILAKVSNLVDIIVKEHGVKVPIDATEINVVVTFVPTA
jgi:hypothetical protein